MAAGRGERMGGAPKQWRLLDGRPVACWAVRALADALAGPLVVVLPGDGVDEGERLLRAHLPEAMERIRLVPGGERRRDSVAAGLGLLSDVEIVLVHDGVRPFASRGLVERVGRRAVGGRAVVPAVRLRDTLKEVEDERVVGTIDRGRLVAAQTPQGFPRPLLAEAHAAAGEDATDDAALCERLGAPVSWIEGEELNRKLTAPGDWAWAEAVVAGGLVRWA